MSSKIIHVLRQIYDWRVLVHTFKRPTATTTRHTDIDKSLYARLIKITITVSTMRSRLNRVYKYLGFRIVEIAGNNFITLVVSGTAGWRLSKYCQLSTEHALLVGVRRDSRAKKEGIMTNEELIVCEEREEEKEEKCMPVIKLNHELLSFPVMEKCSSARVRLLEFFNDQESRAPMIRAITSRTYVWSTWITIQLAEHYDALHEGNEWRSV